MATQRPVSLRQGVLDAMNWLTTSWPSAEKAHKYRSIELGPLPQDGAVYELDTPTEIDSVVATRRRILASQDNLIVTRGRFMVWAPNWDEFDGLLEGESGGFFDVNDSPPWDMWVGWFSHSTQLDDWIGLAWIPAEFVAIVDFAREVEIAPVVRWASEIRQETDGAGPFNALELPSVLKEFPEYD